jgi:hypothetical protein
MYTTASEEGIQRRRTRRLESNRLDTGIETVSSSRYISLTSRLSTCQAESGEEDDHTDHSGLMPIVQDSLPTTHMGISHYIVCSRRREVVFTPHSPAFS